MRAIEYDNIMICINLSKRNCFLCMNGTFSCFDVLEEHCFFLCWGLVFIIFFHFGALGEVSEIEGSGGTLVFKTNGLRKQENDFRNPLRPNPAES